MSELAIKILADYLLFCIVLGGVIGLLLIPNTEKYHAYCRALLAGLTAYLAAKLIGSIFQPELLRPFEKIGAEAGASFLNNPGFPSDHVLFATVITLAVLFESKYRWLGYTLLGLTLLMGVGRVLALVHTPLDVVGGLLIACLGIPWYLQRGSKPLVLIGKTGKKRKKSVK